MEKKRSLHDGNEPKYGLKKMDMGRCDNTTKVHVMRDP